MAVTRIDIVNRALLWIGRDQINSLEDDSPTAKRMSLLYQGEYEGFLTEYDFSFATRRDVLVQAANVRSYLEQGEKVYACPEDCLRLQRVYAQCHGFQHGDMYRDITGRLPEVHYSIRTYGPNNRLGIFTHYDSAAEGRPLIGVWTRNDASLDNFSPDALSALSYRLAASLSNIELNSPEKAQQMYQLYQNAASAAVFHDRSRNRRSMPETSYVLTRWSGFL